MNISGKWLTPTLKCSKGLVLRQKLLKRPVACLPEVILMSFRYCPKPVKILFIGAILVILQRIKRLPRGKAARFVRSARKARLPRANQLKLVIFLDLGRFTVKK